MVLGVPLTLGNALPLRDPCFCSARPAAVSPPRSLADAARDKSSTDLETVLTPLTPKRATGAARYGVTAAAASMPRLVPVSPIPSRPALINAALPVAQPTTAAADAPRKHPTSQITNPTSTNVSTENRPSE